MVHHGKVNRRRSAAGLRVQGEGERDSMPEMMTTDVRALLDRQPFDHSAVADLREVLGRDPSRYRTLRDAVAAMREREKGAMKADVHLRLGVGEVLLGRYNNGLEHLNKAGDNG